MTETKESKLLESVAEKVAEGSMGYKSLPEGAGYGKETVNHPAHYGGDTKYEAIKLIVDWGLKFCSGNALKYIIRAKHKGTYGECLRKALWYLDYAIKIDELQSVADAFESMPTLTPGDAAMFWFPNMGDIDLRAAVVAIANFDWERARRHVLNALGR